MYKLYGDLGSGSCIIELALCELGVAYETAEIDLGASDQRGTKYQAINPQQKVPCLVTGEAEILTESVAILLFLLEKHPEVRLLPPAGDPDRQTAIRWLVFVATELYPIIEINDYPERFCGEGNDPNKTREQARQIWRRRWRIVEDEIKGDPYLLATGFSVTDLYISVVSRWAQQDEWRPRAIPKIQRLCREVANRPRCQAVWHRHFPKES